MFGMLCYAYVCAHCERRKHSKYVNTFLVCVHKADADSDSTRLSMFWETVPHPALVLGIWQMILPLSQLINALHSLKNSATASVQTLHRDFPPEHTSYLKEVRRTSWTATWLYVRRAQYIIVNDFGQNLNDFTYTDFFRGWYWTKRKKNVLVTLDNLWQTADLQPVTSWNPLFRHMQIYLNKSLFLNWTDSLIKLI